MQSFITGKLKRLLKGSEKIHHLESNGEAILLFTGNLKLAGTDEYKAIADFAIQLEKIVNKKKTEVA